MEYKTRNIKVVVHVANKVIWKNFTGEIFSNCTAFGNFRVGNFSVYSTWNLSDRKTLGMYIELSSEGQTEDDFILSVL